MKYLHLATVILAQLLFWWAVMAGEDYLKGKRQSRQNLSKGNEVK